MKILVAEDQVVSRHILAANLRKWGYDVMAVEDGTRAWEVLQAQGAPQLVILDWLMPGMDGIEICLQMRKRPETRPIYLILLTARRGQEDKIHGLQALAIRCFKNEHLPLAIVASCPSIRYLNVFASNLDCIW